MLKLEIIRSHRINSHEFKFKEFCQVFDSPDYELKEVDNKVNCAADGYTTYVTFITYYDFSQNP